MHGTLALAARPRGFVCRAVPSSQPGNRFPAATRQCLAPFPVKRVTRGPPLPLLTQFCTSSRAHRGTAHPWEGAHARPRDGAYGTARMRTCASEGRVRGTLSDSGPSPGSRAGRGRDVLPPAPSGRAARSSEGGSRTAASHRPAAGRLALRRGHKRSRRPPSAPCGRAARHGRGDGRPAAPSRLAPRCGGRGTARAALPDRGSAQPSRYAPALPRTAVRTRRDGGTRRGKRTRRPGGPVHGGHDSGPLGSGPGHRRRDASRRGSGPVHRRRDPSRRGSGPGHRRRDSGRRVRSRPSPRCLRRPRCGPRWHGGTCRHRSRSSRISVRSWLGAHSAAVTHMTVVMPGRRRAVVRARVRPVVVRVAEVRPDVRRRGTVIAREVMVLSPPVHPARRHEHVSGARRNVMAGHPDEARAPVAPVAVDPDGPEIGRRRPSDDDRRWRLGRHLHHDGPGLRLDHHRHIFIFDLRSEPVVRLDDDIVGNLIGAVSVPVVAGLSDGRGRLERARAADRREHGRAHNEAHKKTFHSNLQSQLGRRGGPAISSSRSSGFAPRSGELLLQGDPWC